MLRRVDACIAISSDLEREFRDGGVPAERVHCLPNGVDTERFSPASAEEKAAIRERLGLPTDRPVILYVGVFDCRKNIGWLVKEWAGAQGFGLGALLLAVGPQSRDDHDGGFKGELCRLAEAAPQILRIEGEAADTADYYRAADLFVMPSQSEGLPNAVLEAMATGLCCVAADVSGSRDLIQDGHTGYLFALNDAEALRLALNRGLGSDAQQLGTAARDHVTRGFNIRRIAERYESLYADLLGPAPAARAAQTIHRG
jgi:glycosyltransferase involved in cell wall biosynthesis